MTAFRLAWRRTAGNGPWCPVVTILLLSCLRSVAFAADGTPDLTFAGNLAPGFDGGVYALAVQSDGKVVVGGDFFSVRGSVARRLARLNANGTLDTAFIASVGVTFDAVVKSIAIQPDGKILVGGAFGATGSTRYLVRLNADGTYDTAFNAAVGALFNAPVASVAVQSDGRILVGGQFLAGGGIHGFLARLNANGTPDTNFTVGLGAGFNGPVLAVALQADGKIVAGGAFTALNSNARNHIARLNTDGTQDGTFTGHIGSGNSVYVATVAMQADGKIVAGGNFTATNGGSNGVTRLNTNGTFDAAFLANLLTGFNNDVAAVRLQGDKIVVAGNFTSVAFGNGIARLNANGSRDTTFSADLGTGFEGTGFAYALAVQSDGKLIVGGDFRSVYGVETRSLVRLGTTYRAFPLTIVPTGTGTSAVTSAPLGIFCGSDCRETYPEGTVVTLTAGDSTGKFVSWGPGGCGTNPVCPVTMSGALTITATYVPGATLTVMKSGPGTVTSSPAGLSCGTTCSAVFAQGGVVALTATPDVDARFDFWSGACTGSGSCQITLNANASVSATFSNLPPAISTVAPAQGTSRGGTLVTLRGTGFRAPASVTLGGADALDVVVVDRTTVTLRTPALTPGVKAITLRNGDGQTATVNGAFTVVTTPSRTPDLDHNGEVDVFDATILTACLGVVPTQGTSCWESDLDDSGTVDRADLDVLAAAYDQSGLPTASSMTLRGASVSTFNPTGATIWFDLPGGTFDRSAGVVVSRNDDPFDDELLVIEASFIRVNGALLEGRNHFEVEATTSAGDEILFEVTLWAGSFTLNGILQNVTFPFPGGTVTATIHDAEHELSWTIATTTNAAFQFTNVPNRSLTLTARTADNRVLSTALRGDAGFVALQMRGLAPPSTIDNNDLSQGAAGWIGDGIVTIVPHVEARTALPQAVDSDIELRTTGVGPKYLTRVFTVKPGVRNVTIRFRFRTSEFPAFFGTRFDDQYSVVVTTRNAAGFYGESQSMNSLGREGFDPLGQTAWRELSVPIAQDGEVVQLDIMVANVGDAMFDSSVIVDRIAETGVYVHTLELLDIDNLGLRHLSASPHSYFDDAKTHINGRLTIRGPNGDSLTGLVLEIMRSGEVVTTAQLADSAAAQLLKPFGPEGKVEVARKQLLFTLGSDWNIPDEDTDLELRMVITTALGGTIRANGCGRTTACRMGMLVRVTDVPHYNANRDRLRGGDDWARPSLRRFARHFSDAAGFSWNDFSNMNGGSFEKDHKSHQRGNDADGVFAGYRDLGPPARETINGCHPTDTTNAATGILRMLEDPVYGPQIKKVFVTCARYLNPDAPFWKALDGKRMPDGRKFTTIVQHTNHHYDHFHVRIREDQGN